MSTLRSIALACLLSAFQAKAANFPYLESWGPDVPSHATNVVSIARSCGDYHLGLRSDGTVVVWGPFAPSVPAGISGLKSVSGGSFHCVGLFSNGTVIAWGNNAYSESTNVPPGLSGVIAVSAGQYHSAALKSDGTVITWGLNNYQQLNMPSGLSNVVAIAAADYCTIAVLDDGTVTGWGFAGSPQLNIPTEATNAVAVAAHEHTLILRGDGSLVAWGRNDFGQANVPPIQNAVAVAVGATHSLVLKSDGTVVSWGGSAVPVPEFMSGVSAIAANVFESLVLTARPRISTPPAALNLVPGSSASFSVAASGNTPLSYQWHLGSNSIAGASNSTFSIASATTNDAGFYSVVVSDQTGAKRRSAAAELIFGGIAVSGGASNGVAHLGQTITLFLTATSSLPVGYQWQKDGQDLPGATNNPLVLSNVQLADAGTYRLSTTAGNYVSVRETHLTVLSPPIIVEQPRDTAIWGDYQFTGNFYVAVTGTPPFRIQWQKNGVNILGANGSTCVANAGDAGMQFRAVITNAVGSVTSAPATFYFNTIPPPLASVTVYAGDDATFSISVAGGGPLRYQWQRNGSPVPGATNATLVLSNVTLSDSGSTFSVICYNLTGEREFGGLSGPAQLTVRSQTPIILGQPQGTTAAFGTPVVFTVVADGDEPIAFQWRHHGTNLVNTTNISGANSASLRIESAHLQAAGNYQVLVANAFGSVTSQVATLTISEYPRILEEPLDIAASGGETVSFDVVAISPHPMVYQWQKDGSPIAGKTNDVLTLSNVSTADIANYRVIVSNAFGGLSVTSAIAKLALHEAPIILAQSSNTTTHIHGDAFLSVTAMSATPVSFQWRKDNVQVPGGDTGLLLFKNIRLQDAGTYDVIAASPAGAVTSSPITLTVSSARPVGTVVGLNTPLVPPGLTNVVAVSAGPYLNAAMTVDGGLRIWTDTVGYLLFGSSPPPSMTNILALESGIAPNEAFALNDKGEVLNWHGAATGITNASSIYKVPGGPLYAVLWDGGLQRSSLPMGLSNVVSVTFRGGDVAALRRNGTVVSAPLFQTVIASNVVSIAGSMELRADGTITGPLAGLSNVVSIGSHCCIALLNDGTVVTGNSHGTVTGALAISTAGESSLVLATNLPTPVVQAYATTRGVRVSAPISVSGYLLESSPNITGQYTPVVLGTNELVFRPVPFETNQFYRLRRE